MPLTPYHLGPASAVGIIFKRVFDIPSLLVSSVIVDFEPFIILLFNIDRPLHGFFHSFLVGSGVAAATALFMHLSKGWIRPIMEAFRLEQDSSFVKILATCLVGVYSHVLLDSFPYSDIKPFYPYDFNPFYRSVSLSGIRIFCLACFGVAIAAYFIRLIMERKNGNGPETETLD